MVSSMTRKMISLAISLLVVVISLTGAALAATAPTNVTALTPRYVPGFSGAPGNMARDEAGNFYVTDFWGKGIMKLGPNGVKSGFIPTNGRPSAVAVMPDGRLVVAIQAPEAYVAFYSQSGTAPNITGSEVSRFTGQPTPYYRPSAITVGVSDDTFNYIYVLDAGDLTSSVTNFGCVRVYDANGTYKTTFGARTNVNSTPAASPGGDFQFKQPLGIAYEKNAKQIIVADSVNGRLQFYNAYANGVGCTFVKTVGMRAGKGNVPSNNTQVKFADPQGIALEYDDSNVFYRIYVSEKALNEIVIIDAAAHTPSTCTGASKICDNWQLKRLNSTTVTDGGMKFPVGVSFENTATGVGVLYVANAASSTTEANILALSIDSGAIPTATTSVAINPLAANVYSSTLSVGGSVSPSGTSVSCSLNGSDTFNGATVTGTSWTISIPSLVANQINYINCKTTDASDKKYTYYAFDTTTAPSLAIASPADNSITKSSTAQVTGTSDAGASISSSVTGSICTSTDLSVHWTCSVPLAEGSNTITISASKPGTQTATLSRTVVKDTAAPGLVVSALLEDAVTNIAVQNIDGIVTDDNFGSVEVNDVVVPASARMTTGTSTYFSVPVTLVRGSNVITVKATDLLGNFTIKTRNVTLNPEIAGLTVTLPADNSYLNAPATIPASGTAGSGFNTVDSKYNTMDNELGSWTANGSYDASSGTWSGSFTAVAGFKEYQFVSFDGVNTLAAKRTINTNAAYAQLSITEPPVDKAVKADDGEVYATIAVQGVSVPGKPTVSLDGVAVNPTSITYDTDTKAFGLSVTLSTEGTHYIKVTADEATSAIRTIIYDKTAPVLGIQANSRSMPSMISGSIEGSAKISAINATLSGVPVSIPLSVLTFSPYNSATDSVVWHANLSSYTFDAISFTTTDPAGNSKTRQRTTVTPKGDVDRDGYVRLSDALAALRHTAGTQLLTGDNFTEGDVGSLIDGQASSDGDVDIIDSVLILRKAYGLINF